MPILHPDPPRIPPDLHSEREVLAALRTLPPEAHVFVRLRILDTEANKDRELDFLVLHPELGLVIIEVKGKGVEPQGDHWVRRHGAGHAQRLDETPGEQMQAQQYTLLRYLKGEEVGFVPQITRVLAMPFLALDDDQGLGPDLPACRILTRGKLKNTFLSLRAAVTGGAPWKRGRVRSWRALTASAPTRCAGCWMPSHRACCHPPALRTSWKGKGDCRTSRPRGCWITSHRISAGAATTSPARRARANPCWPAR